MDILLVLAVGAMSIGCFVVGAKVGQQVAKGEKVDIQSMNPLKAHREHEAKREAEQEQKRVEAIWHNIEAYNGTKEGQKDIPRG